VTRTLSHNYCCDDVRRNDYNLYLLHFFMPRQNRRNALALMAMHVELNAIAMKSTDPMIRLIRLKWWGDEVEKITSGNPHADSPVLDEVETILSCSTLKFDNYFDQFEKSFRDELCDVDEAFYDILTSLIHNEKAKSKFIKKLMLHDQLGDDVSLRAFRLLFGV